MTVLGCPLCDPPIALTDGRELVLRHGSRADAPALERLYRTLTNEDLSKRFFSGGCPDSPFFERWASIEERGGLSLVAELRTEDAVEIVAEAGYSQLADGDVELGIAVRRDRRGWTGAWILDALFRHARDRGIDNIQAVIKTSNRGMMRLATGRGCAVLDHPDWGVVHVTMGTDGEVPSWPPNTTGTRVLIESERSRWPEEEMLRRGGATVIICNSVAKPEHQCPALVGESCPLVAGADVIVVDLPVDDPKRAQLLDGESQMDSHAVIVSSARPEPGSLESRSAGLEIVERSLAALPVPDPTNTATEPDRAGDE